MPEGGRSKRHGKASKGFSHETQHTEQRTSLDLYVDIKEIEPNATSYVLRPRTIFEKDPRPSAPVWWWGLLPLLTPHPIGSMHLFYGNSHGFEEWHNEPCVVTEHMQPIDEQRLWDYGVWFADGSEIMCVHEQLFPLEGKPVGPVTTLPPRMMYLDKKKAAENVEQARQARLARIMEEINAATRVSG